MNEYYKKSIAVFGIAIPVVLMAVIAIAALSMLSSTNVEYRKKKQVYDKDQNALKQISKLQGKVKQNASHLANWDSLMKNETRGTFLEHWKTAEKRFSGRELTKASHNWTNYSDGLGRGASQPASQVNMSFSATYKAMQLALMEMETRLPQMQLDSLTMKPDGNGEALKFDTTFTVWTLK